MKDCMNQFQFYINDTYTFTTALGNFAPWVSGTNNSWVVKSGANQFDFDIEGFNNINLYGIKLIADIQSGVSGANHGIVEDYKFRINFSGVVPLISGVFQTNTWNAGVTTNQVTLSKYQNEILFVEPIQSCKNIRVTVFSAQGFNNQSLTEIKLDIIAQLYFYYKYEGVN